MKLKLLPIFSIVAMAGISNAAAVHGRTSLYAIARGIECHATNSLNGEIQMNKHLDQNGESVLVNFEAELPEGGRLDMSITLNRDSEYTYEAKIAKAAN